MTTHNPKKIIEQLQVILSNPAKKIGFLFGAGISAKDKQGDDLIQTSQTILDNVIGNFEGNNKSAIEAIQKEIEDTQKIFNIESLLSKISEKESAVGNESLCGLNKDNLVSLREAIENKIKEIVSIHKLIDFNKKELNHYDFANWIGNANRDFPVEIFTTNYDYLMEIALEKVKIPYFDGFIGSYKAFFHPEWIEDNRAVKDWTKLWKLHGSLGWAKNDKEIIRVSDSKDSAMIYPSFLKYDHSRKQPYLSYMDRLAYFLKQEDSVLFVNGYSFGDDHINGTIFTSLNSSRSSHAFIFKRGDLNLDEPLSKYALNNSKISIYATRHAIIGGKYGNWQLEKEPDRNQSYNIIDHGFDEDGFIEKEGWTGTGEFRLGNFTDFTNFLSLFHANSKYIIKV